MKLLVFSDSHGGAYAMREAMRRNRGTVDYAVFACDGERDFALLSAEFPEVTYRAVRGNCDFASRLPVEETLEVEGKRVLIVHGHLFGVKSSRTPLRLDAQKRGFDLVIFGHTHSAEEIYFPAEGGFKALWMFNPGSARAGDFGVVEIGDGGILCSHGSVYGD